MYALYRMTDIVSTCYLLSVNNKNNGKTNKQTKNIVFFSYTKKTIYLYLFTYSAGGQDGVLLETCIQCCDCTDKRSHGHKQENWPHFSWTRFHVFLQYSSADLAIFTRTSFHPKKLNLCGSPWGWNRICVLGPMLYTRRNMLRWNQLSRMFPLALYVLEHLTHQQIHPIRLHQPLLLCKTEKCGRINIDFITLVSFFTAT